MGLKIGFVTGEYPPMEGGVGAFTQELTRELSLSGHEIHIVTSKKAKPESTGRSIWDIREPHDIENATLHPHVGRWRWGAMSKVASVAIRFNLDIVNVQYQAIAYDMYFPAINYLPWRLREVVPVVATFHDLRVPYLFPKAGNLRKRIVYHLAGSADGVICTNQADVNTLHKAEISSEKVELIPIGSNIAPHDAVDEEILAVRSKLGLKSTDILVGYFGFVNSSKGVDNLIQALASLSENVHLVLIGGETGSSDQKGNLSEFETIKDMIRGQEVGRRVHWSGFLPDHEVSAYLSAAEVIVLPYKDGASLRRGTLMAVIAHGRPLITTEPTVPTPELVHGENVWLTPIDDPSSLGEAMENLLEDPALQEKLGEGAVALSQRFSWDVIADRTAHFFSKVINRSDN